MKTRRLSLAKVRAIISREQIHRARRKKINFAKLYGGNTRKFIADVRGTGMGTTVAVQSALQAARDKKDVHAAVPEYYRQATVKGDLHSFKNTPVRTGRIKGVMKVHND